MCARAELSTENIVLMRENVTESSNATIRHRTQKLLLPTATLRQILTRRLSLDEYKIQLTQIDPPFQAPYICRLDTCTKPNEMKFLGKSSSATKSISISIATLTSRITE